MFHGLGFERGEASSVVDSGIDRMFDASALFGFFGVVPAIESTYQVAGDAAETFKFAFVEIFGMCVEIFFGGGIAGFFVYQFHTNFYEA